MIFLSFLIPVRSIYMLCSTFRRDWRKLRWYVYRNVIIYLYVIVCYKEHRNFCNSNRISLFSDALISFKFNHWMTLTVHKLAQYTELFSEAMISFKFNHCMTDCLQHWHYFVQDTGRRQTKQ